MKYLGRSLRVILFLLLCCFAGFDLKAENPKPAFNARSLEMNEEGVKALRASDLKKAQSLFSKALAIDSGNITAAYNLASVEILLKQEQKDITLLKEYRVRAPNDAGLHAMLGDAHFANRQIKEAEQFRQFLLQLLRARVEKERRELQDMLRRRRRIR